MLSKQKYYKNVANTIIQNFKKRQIEGYYCANKEDAVKKALELIPKGSSVSYGGSMTIIESGLMNAIESNNYNLIKRENASNLEEERKIYSEICASDFFLMSTNGAIVVVIYNFLLL